MEGHGRYRLLGSTLDDAAGEAFDKVARYLGLGYPGGPAIDRLADGGRSRRHRASPGPCCDDGLDFSFSGLKTSVVNHVRKHPDVATADVAASFQEAVVDVLVTKARRAAAQIGAKGMCLGGGVAANSRLRERVRSRRAWTTGSAAFLPSRGHVHRQRGDGGRRRLVAPRRRRPERPRPRRRPEPALPLPGVDAGCIRLSVRRRDPPDGLALRREARRSRASFAG